MLISSQALGAYYVDELVTRADTKSVWHSDHQSPSQVSSVTHSSTCPKKG